MKILAVNAGSSSFKFELVELPEKNVLASGLFEKVGNVSKNFRKKYFFHLYFHDSSGTCRYRRLPSGHCLLSYQYA